MSYANFTTLSQRVDFLSKVTRTLWLILVRQSNRVETRIPNLVQTSHTLKECTITRCFEFLGPYQGTVTITKPSKRCKENSDFKKIDWKCRGPRFALCLHREYSLFSGLRARYGIWFSINSFFLDLCTRMRYYDVYYVFYHNWIWLILYLE